MSQKKVSGIIFCILLIISVFVLGYLIGTNRSTKNIEVTYGHSAEAKKEDETKTVASSKPVESVQDGLIDLNTADQEQLETLPGIGPELASRILEYRASIGAFESVEQLKNVSGIGEKRYSEIEDLVTVGGVE